MIFNYSIQKTGKAINVKTVVAFLFAFVLVFYLGIYLPTMISTSANSSVDSDYVIEFDGNSVYEYDDTIGRTPNVLTTPSADLSFIDNRYIKIDFFQQLSLTDGLLYCMLVDGIKTSFSSFSSSNVFSVLQLNFAPIMQGLATFNSTYFVDLSTFNLVSEKTYSVAFFLANPAYFDNAVLCFSDLGVSFSGVEYESIESISYSYNAFSNPIFTN